MSDNQVQSWQNQRIGLRPFNFKFLLYLKVFPICTHSCCLSSLFSKSIKDNAKASGNFPGRRTEVSVQPRKTEFRARTLLAERYLGPQTSLLIFGRTLSSKNSHFHISLGQDGTFVTWVLTFSFLGKSNKQVLGQKCHEFSIRLTRWEYFDR